MEIDELLRPVAVDAPCGPDLEYDGDFHALEVAARGRPEQEIGKSFIPAEPPDWKAVERLAAALFARTKDLRVAVAWTHAETALRGVAGLADGLELIDGMVRAFWAELHPRLDPDDGDDPTMRMNVLAPLADPSRLLRTLRGARLAAAPGVGPVLVRHVEAALGTTEAAPGDPALSLEQVEALLASCAEDELLSAVGRALGAAASLSDALAERVGAHNAVDLKPLVSRLRPLAELMRRARGAAADSSDGGAAADAGDGASTAASTLVPARAATPVGEIRDRDDAKRALERICEFLERTEPSNPAPLLIRRAIRLMSMSFLDIVRDMAPESLNTVEAIAGNPRAET